MNGGVRINISTIVIVCMAVFSIGTTTLTAVYNYVVSKTQIEANQVTMASRLDEMQKRLDGVDGSLKTINQAIAEINLSIASKK
jgi:hypothetical protein